MGSRVGRGMRKEVFSCISLLSQMIGIRIVYVFLISRELSLILPFSQEGSVSKFAPTASTMCSLLLLCLIGDIFS